MALASQPGHEQPPPRRRCPSPEYVFRLTGYRPTPLSQRRRSTSVPPPLVAREHPARRISTGDMPPGQSHQCDAPMPHPVVVKSNPPVATIEFTPKINTNTPAQYQAPPSWVLTEPVNLNEPFASSLSVDDPTFGTMVDDPTPPIFYSFYHNEASRQPVTPPVSQYAETLSPSALARTSMMPHHHSQHQPTYTTCAAQYPIIDYVTPPPTTALEPSPPRRQRSHGSSSASFEDDTNHHDNHKRKKVAVAATTGVVGASALGLVVVGGGPLAAVALAAGGGLCLVARHRKKRAANRNNNGNNDGNGNSVSNHNQHRFTPPSSPDRSRSNYTPYTSGAYIDI